MSVGRAIVRSDTGNPVGNLLFGLLIAGIGALFVTHERSKAMMVIGGGALALNSLRLFFQSDRPPFRTDYQLWKRIRLFYYLRLISFVVSVLAISYLVYLLNNPNLSGRREMLGWIAFLGIVFFFYFAYKLSNYRQAYGERIGEVISTIPPKIIKLIGEKITIVGLVMVGISILGFICFVLFGIFIMPLQWDLSDLALDIFGYGLIGIPIAIFGWPWAEWDERMHKILKEQYDEL